MNSKISNKLVWLFTLFYGGISALLVWSHFSALTETKNAWQSDSGIIQEQYALVEQLHSSFGYGGYIHHFKNAVLRGYDSYRIRLDSDGEKVAQTVLALKQVLLSDNDKQRLQVIEDTFLQYRSNEAILAGLINTSSTEIDQQVKVDDIPAIQALARLRESVFQQSQQANQLVYNRLTSLNQYSFAFYIFVLASCIQFVIIANTIVRYKYQKTLAERNAAHLEAIINSNPEALLQVDTDGKIVSANVCANEVFEVDEKTLIGQSVENFIPDSFRQQHKQQRQAFLQTGNKRAMSDRKDLKAVTHKGNTIDVEISLNRFVWQGTTLFILVVRDVTQDRRRQLSVSRKTHLQAIGQLTAGVAHDFNNLLMSIEGNKELVTLSLDTDKPVEKYLDNISISVQKASALNQKLLAFARKQHLDIEAASCKEIFGEVEAILASSIGAKTHLNFSCAPNVWSINVDRIQMETALINLCLNAHQAIDGTGSISVAASNIVLDKSFNDDSDVPMEGNFVLVVISDTGKGIKKADMENIFEPYFTTKGSHGGTGLGLSMVFGFIKQIGGHINVYSEEEMGTTVKLFIPANTRDKTIKVHKAIHKDEPVNNPDGHNSEQHKWKTILVVEDDDDVRGIPVSLLKERGFQVIEAHNSEEAMKQSKRLNHLDLIFTDIVLGNEENGVAISKQVKILHPDAKVLFTTGYAPEFLHTELGANLENSTLMKPYSKQDLFNAVEKALQG